MRKEQIITHCVTKLKMTQEQAEWVSENLYNYVVPDWSEMSWAEINRCLRDTLIFKPIQTTADKLRVGDTVKPDHFNFRLIADIEARPDRIIVTDDLGLNHPFSRNEKVLTQLLQLL